MGSNQVLMIPTDDRQGIAPRGRGHRPPIKGLGVRPPNKNRNLKPLTRGYRFRIPQMLTFILYFYVYHDIFYGNSRLRIFFISFSKIRGKCCSSNFCSDFWDDVKHASNHQIRPSPTHPDRYKPTYRDIQTFDSGPLMNSLRNPILPNHLPGFFSGFPDILR